MRLAESVHSIAAKELLRSASQTGRLGLNRSCLPRFYDAVVLERSSNPDDLVLLLLSARKVRP